MNKVLKYIIFVLCLIGIVCISNWLNNISAENVTGVGLGYFLLMFAGFRSLARKIYNIIFELQDGDSYGI
jgi:hypothetical protein